MGVKGIPEGPVKTIETPPKMPPKNETAGIAAFPGGIFLNSSLVASERREKAVAAAVIHWKETAHA